MYSEPAFTQIQNFVKLDLGTDYVKSLHPQFRGLDISISTEAEFHYDERENYPANVSVEVFMKALINRVDYEVPAVNHPGMIIQSARPSEIYQESAFGISFRCYWFLETKFGRTKSNLSYVSLDHAKQYRTSFSHHLSEVWAMSVEDLKSKGVANPSREQVYHNLSPTLRIEKFENPGIRPQITILQYIEFKSVKNQAQAAEAAQDWDKANALYKEASNYSNEKGAMQAKANEMATKSSTEEKVAEAETLASEAASLASEENYEGAAEKYEAAAKLDESKNAEYSEKAEEMRKKQSAKEEEEAGAAEDEKGEELSESESEGDEGEEGDEAAEAEEGEEDNSAVTSDDSYDEAAAAAQEEYERQERVADYWENRNAATQENMNAASEMGAQALLVHLMLGKLIYGNMSKETSNSKMAGPGNMFTTRLGYGFSSLPMFTNSENETYNGNSYGTNTSTKNFQSFTLEMGLGMEYWPIYSDGFGLGGSLDLFAGHGLLFEQFSYGGNYSLQGYIGGDNMQLYAAFRQGIRVIHHNPWIEDGEYGGGKSGAAYSRITVGPQFRFLYDGGSHFTTLGILGILERNSGHSSMFEDAVFGAAVFSHSPGLRLEWNKRNRFSFGAEAVFNYRRSGEARYNYHSEATFNGTMFNINFHRRFDRFPHSALRIHNPKAVYKRIRDYEGFYLNLLQPNLSWITSDSSSTNTLKPFIGVDLVGVKYVQKLYKGIGLSLGLNGSYTGVRFNYFTSVNRAGINLPLAVRFHLPGVLARYYLETGYKFHYYFHNRPVWRSGLFKAEEVSEYVELPLKNTFGSYRIGAGMAIPGTNKNTSVGIVYERSTSAVNTGLIVSDFNNQDYSDAFKGDVLLHQLSIQFAFQF